MVSRWSPDWAGWRWLESSSRCVLHLLSSFRFHATCKADCVTQIVCISLMQWSPFTRSFTILAQGWESCFLRLTISCQNVNQHGLGFWKLVVQKYFLSQHLSIQSPRKQGHGGGEASHLKLYFLLLGFLSAATHTQSGPWEGGRSSIPFESSG